MSHKRLEHHLLEASIETRNRHQNIFGAIIAFAKDGLQGIQTSICREQGHIIHIQDITGIRNLPLILRYGNVHIRQIPGNQHTIVFQQRDASGIRCRTTIKQRIGGASQRIKIVVSLGCDIAIGIQKRDGTTNILLHGASDITYQIESTTLILLVAFHGIIDNTRKLVFVLIQPKLLVYRQIAVYRKGRTIEHLVFEYQISNTRAQFLRYFD